jgi:hypothetical protein
MFFLPLYVSAQKCSLFWYRFCVAALVLLSHPLTVAELRPRMTNRDIPECGMYIVIETKLSHFSLIRGIVEWLLHAEPISAMAMFPVAERHLSAQGVTDDNKQQSRPVDNCRHRQKSLGNFGSIAAPPFGETFVIDARRPRLFTGYVRTASRNISRSRGPFSTILSELGLSP